MPTATLTRKGQVTIPARVRAALGLELGDRVAFVEIAAGRFEVVASTRSVTALKGMFGSARRRVSLEDLMARPPMEGDELPL
jgi:AbrB family looped-hinge helix DNA binding protein